MDIGTAFSFIDYLANKASNGGYIPPSKRTMLAQRAEIEFVSKYYNNVKQYERGDKTPLYGYADTQRVYDNLRPYIVPDFLLTPDSSGSATLPSDYLHPIGFFATYRRSVTASAETLDCGDDKLKTTTISDRKVDVKILTPDQYGYRLSSELKPPTLEYPIAKFTGNLVTIAPSTTLLPKIDYLRKPTGAIYNYTQSGNEPPVYVPDGSLSWEAPEDCHNELCTMVMQYVGIHVSGDMITEFARYKERTGI